MQVLNILHVLVAIAMVAFILVQRGPGATAGAAFGSGASGTVFGSRGAGSFLSRTTWVLATGFCLISLVMAVVVSRNLSTPETDLGVVANGAAVEQTAPEPSMEAPPMMEDPSSDVPMMNMEALEPAVDDATGDLPSVDSAPAQPAGDEGDDG